MIRYVSHIEPQCHLGGKHRFRVEPGSSGHVRKCKFCGTTKVVMKKDERMWFIVRPNGVVPSEAQG